MAEPRRQPPDTVSLLIEITLIPIALRMLRLHTCNVILTGSAYAVMSPMSDPPALVWRTAFLVLVYNCLDTYLFYIVLFAIAQN